MDISAPGDNFVTLPAGLYEPGGLTDTAEIRELNGFDEEFLAKSNSRGQALQGILERAVVKVGDVPATRALLDQLPLPDRVELLVKIRQLTWGDEAVFTNIICPECEEKITVTINLKDLPRRVLEDKVADRFWDLPIRKGTAKLTLPSGELHRKTLMMTKETTAEVASMFIADCVVEVENSVMVGIGLARNLNLGDREKIITSISKVMPGPLLEEVKASCPECSAEFPFPLVLGALFPM